MSDFLLVAEWVEVYCMQKTVFVSSNPTQVKTTKFLVSLANLAVGGIS